MHAGPPEGAHRHVRPPAEPYRALGVRVCPLVPIANRPLCCTSSTGCGPPACGRSPSSATERRARRWRRWWEAGARSSPSGTSTTSTAALDAPAIAVQPRTRSYAPLQDLLGEVASAPFDGVVVRVPAIAPAIGTTDVPPIAAPAHVGACLLGPEAADGLGASLDDAGASVDALADALIASSSRVHQDEVRGCLACCDGDDGLLRANRLALEGLEPAVEGAQLVDTEIQGPAVIHPSAVVRSTLVRGPAVIGPGVRLNDVYIGPYTSIGEDVVIEGAEIEHSLVLAGAEVRYPGVRVATSIIGPRARLVRDFHLPRGMRVAVGADAVVALS